MGFASEMLVGSVLLLLLAAAVGERPEWPPQPLAAWSWVYLIVFGSLLAFNAYMVLLSRVSAALASSYTFVNPVIALALGIWLGGETVTAFEWAAAAVITAGVVLLVLGRQPVKAAAA
jgi:drug/metabolite transporter (DMT)-like permease